MHRIAPFSRRACCRRIGCLTLATLVGCAEPTAVPIESAPPSAIIIIGGHPALLNAQLRAIGNPDEKPLVAVVGHLQLVITETDGGLVVSWSTHLANPECNGSTSFGGGAVYIQDSEDFPSPEDVGVLRLLPPGDPLGCGDTFLQGSSPISEELAASLVVGPEYFVAFFLDDGSVIGGELQVAGSDLLETR